MVEWMVDSVGSDATSLRVGALADALGVSVLADLAAELGFADQAHLSRSFSAAVGQSPSRYASRIAPDRPTYRTPAGSAVRSGG